MARELFCPQCGAFIDPPDGTVRVCQCLMCNETIVIPRATSAARSSALPAEERPSLKQGHRSDAKSSRLKLEKEGCPSYPAGQPHLGWLSRVVSRIVRTFHVQRQQLWHKDERSVK